MYTPPKNEVLEIRNIGPIKELRIEPKPLTLFIGEQASGKSLAAQLLYFFRELPSLLGRSFTPSVRDKTHWRENEIITLLDQFRGTPFSCFANGGSMLKYIQGEEKPWVISWNSKEDIVLSSGLLSAMNKWANQWSEDSSTLGETRKTRHIFIPTERSVFTRLAEDEPSVLYAPYQTMFLRQFATVLERAKKTYSLIYGADVIYSWHGNLEKHVNYIMNCQRNALGGEACLSEEEQRSWEWVIKDSNKKIPIKATSSGQMEAWPFFAIAHSYGAMNVGSDPICFYCEEPEAHLHPQAQVEVVRAIAYLVNNGHQFVVTTHSPYTVYKFNNMIQRYLSTGMDFDEEAQESGLGPDKVCAYRFRAAQAGPPEDILDRRDTRLIEPDALNRVADELSEEFDKVFFAKDK